MEIEQLWAGEQMNAALKDDVLNIFWRHCPYLNTVSFKKTLPAV